jgi:Protein of unknown function (DUF565)
MQNTRLNTLIQTLIDRITEQLRNPWRGLLLRFLALLLGFFLGSAIVTTAGQLAQFDIFVAAFLVVFVELVSRFAYRLPRLNPQSFPLPTLNAVKIGLTYSLFVEALKLGS